MSQGHSLKVRRFRSSISCGREEFLLVRTLTFLTFKIFYMHKNKYKLLKDRKKNENDFYISKCSV